MSRFKPHENSPLAHAIHEAHSNAVLDSISTDLVDLHRLQTGLESIETLAVGIDTINNGEHNAETLLGVNRATHLVSDVFEDESLRPTNELTAENINEVSMEGIVGAAIKAIIKVLKWIITAPVRFVKWLFDKERMMKMKTATVDKAVSAAASAVRGKQYSTFDLELKYVGPRVKTIGDVGTTVKLNSDILRGFMEGIESDIRQILPMARWTSLDQVESGWAYFSPSNNLPVRGALWGYSLKPRETALPKGFKPQELVKDNSYNDFDDNKIKTSKKDEHIAREVFDIARKEADACFQKAAETSKTIADIIVKLQKVSERLLRIIDKPNGDGKLPDSIQEYSTFAAGIVGVTIQNAQVLDKLVNMFDVHVTSIVTPVMETVMNPNEQDKYKRT